MKKSAKTDVRTEERPIRSRAVGDYADYQIVQILCWQTISSSSEPKAATVWSP